MTANKEPALWDVEAERAFLGSVIEQGYGVKESGLMPNEFALVEHQLIVAACYGLEDAKAAINVVSLAGKLDACECKELDDLGRALYYEELRQKYGYSARIDNVATYVGLIREKTDRRRLIDTAEALRAGALNGRKPAETAAEVIQRLEAMAKPKNGPQESKVSQMKRMFNGLRLPIIFGLIRVGETMNVIAPPKTGKSWLVILLALCVATGRLFLGMLKTKQGKVLIIDNELHSETIADRIPQVADEMGIQLEDYDDNIGVISLRGHLLDIHGIVAMLLENYKPGELRLVIIDALYRALPKGISENDNAGMAEVYNAIDNCAMELGCAFVLIHHSSKGNQSGKSVTDVGAGAGAQSRATDCHLVIREHEQPGVFVVDAAVRSWAPLEPICLQREFPIWRPVEGLDPTALKPERPRRAAKDKTEGRADKPPAMTVATFASEFITAEPSTEGSILARATTAGLSLYNAKQLLKCAKGLPAVHTWTFKPRDPWQYSTVPKPALPLEAELNTPELPNKRGRPKRKKNVSCVSVSPPSTPQETA